MVELVELIACIECGAPIEAGFGRSCALGDGSFLCFDCAAKRGGVWDEAHDTWVEMPHESGLPDARRPHA